MPADPDFENLVALYYRDLFRFAYSLARNESEAADFTQQTFYLWARKGHQLREAGQVKSWLFTTLHREFLQVRRRQRRFPELELEEAAGELPEIAPEAMARMDGETVLEFLGQIEAHQQAADPITWKIFLQADRHGVGHPLGMVQSRIARGKARLYQLLNTVRPPPSQTRRKLMNSARFGKTAALPPAVDAESAFAEVGPGGARSGTTLARGPICRDRGATREAVRDRLPPTCGKLFVNGLCCRSVAASEVRLQRSRRRSARGGGDLLRRPAPRNRFAAYEGIRRLSARLPDESGDQRPGADSRVFGEQSGAC